VFLMLMLSDSLTGELVQSSAVSVSGSSPSALRHCASVYVKFALGCTLISKSTWQMERTDLPLALYPSLLLSVCFMLRSDRYLSEEYEETAHIHSLCFCQTSPRLQVE